MEQKINAGVSNNIAVEKIIPHIRKTHKHTVKCNVLIGLNKISDPFEQMPIEIKLFGANQQQQQLQQTREILSFLLFSTKLCGILRSIRLHSIFFVAFFYSMERAYVWFYRKKVGSRLCAGDDEIYWVLYQERYCYFTIHC